MHSDRAADSLNDARVSNLPSHVAILDIHIVKLHPEPNQLEPIMRHILVLPCLLAFAAPAIADGTGKTYVELSGVYTFISDSGYEAYPGALKLTLGHEFTDWLAAEGFAGTGIVDANFNVGAANVNVQIDNFYGVNLRPFVRSNAGHELFARVGYFHGQLSGSAVGPGGFASAYSYGGSFSFGAGGALAISDSTKLTLDLTRYYQGGGTTINGVAAGLRFHF